MPSKKRRHQHGAFVGVCFVIANLVGGGVLPLGSAVSVVGLVAGPITLLVFFAVALWCARLQSAVFQSGGGGDANDDANDDAESAEQQQQPQQPQPRDTYRSAVRQLMGPRHAVFVACLQNAFFFVVTVGNTTVAAAALALIAALRTTVPGAAVVVASSSTPNTATGTAPPVVPLPPPGSAGASVAAANAASGLVSAQQAAFIPRMAAAFGALQLLLSLLPDMRALWVLSIAGAALSVVYVGLGVGIAAGAMAVHGGGLGRLAGEPSKTAGARAVAVAKALGDMAFVWGLALNLLEIEATLRQPPAATKTMRKCATIGLTVAVVLYVSYGCTLYASMGALVPPHWGRAQWDEYATEPKLLMAVSALIALAMAPATQFKAQPAFAELWALACRARCGRWGGGGRRGGGGGTPGDKEPAAPASSSSRGPASWPRWARVAAQVAIRWLYVVAATVIAIMLPSPSILLGLAGAAVFAPLVVAYPIEMHARLHPPSSRSGWAVRRLVQALAATVSAVACVGIVVDAAWASSQGAAGATVAAGGGSKARRRS